MGSVLYHCIIIAAILSFLMGHSEAATFTFTYRQATYIVVAVAFVYVVLCIVLLIILCRVMNRCSCCHKGKVCPSMATTGSNDVAVRYNKSGDFIEIERYSRKKSVAAIDDKRNRKLESIPEGGKEDDIIANFAALEEESLRSKASRGSSIHRLDTKSSVSTSTALTTIDIQGDNAFSKVPSPTSPTGAASLAQFFEMKAKEESPLSMMGNKLASETGMYELLGMEHSSKAKINDEGDKEDEPVTTITITPPPDREPIDDKSINNNTNTETASTRDELKPQTTKDLFTDEFQLPQSAHGSTTVIANPHALGSHSAHSIATSPITVAVKPLPPIQLKRVDHADISLTSHWLNRIKGSESPGTRSLPDINARSGTKSKSKNKPSPYTQRVQLSTVMHYTPNKKPLLQPLKMSTNTTTTNSQKGNPPVNELIDNIQRHDVIKSTLIQQKSEVCVVEEADSNNELTMI